MCPFQNVQVPETTNMITQSHHTLLPPLGDVDWLDDPGNFIHKGNSSSDVVEDGHVSDLFPGHGHVFQQLQYSVGHVLEGTVQQKESLMSCGYRYSFSKESLSKYLNMYILLTKKLYKDNEF